MKKKWLYFIPIILVIVVGTVFIIENNSKKEDLISRGKFSVATVTKLTLGYKSNTVVFHYEFKDEKQDLIIDSKGIRLQKNQVFINKKFPVIYDPQQPTNNVLLIKRVYFEEFSIPFPDSLSWVENYEK